MKITIQSPGFKATKRLEKFTQKNIQKLESFSQRIIEAQVCLKTGNTEEAANKICELRIVIPGNDLFASKQSSTFEESVMKAIDAIKHQLEKIKTLKERRRTIDSAVDQFTSSPD